MAIKYIDLDDDYFIKTDTENIMVSVIIGEGQEGSYSIFLGPKFISANESGNIGKKSGALDHKTTISVVVVDQLEETNMTSITVNIKEKGHGTVKYGPYKAEAEKHLDTLIYTLKLNNR